jgi:hypothetical protein
VKPGDGMGAIGGPEPDSAAALKRDAADAARDYRKPEAQAGARRPEPLAKSPAAHAQALLLTLAS